MISTSFKFVSTCLETNSIGVQKEVQKTSGEIPIIKIEDVYSSEYYKANELGYKPSLRIRTSALNYNQQESLIYKDVLYSIIRTQEIGDEIVLICERKIKNV